MPPSKGTNEPHTPLLNSPRRLLAAAATSTGGTVSASTVWWVWQDARTIGLSPEQQVTPLAGWPYDLRHACATLLLNAEVPPKEVARRLGHSVEVLWKVYAGCLDGDEERINRMIEKALAA
ncbi:MAG: hypothetical protein ACJ72W_26805 [Actinoallomurus sp.]